MKNICDNLRHFRALPIDVMTEEGIVKHEYVTGLCCETGKQCIYNTEYEDNKCKSYKVGDKK